MYRCCIPAQACSWKLLVETVKEWSTRYTHAQACRGKGDAKKEGKAQFPFNTVACKGACLKGVSFQNTVPQPCLQGLQCFPVQL